MYVPSATLYPPSSKLPRKPMLPLPRARIASLRASIVGSKAVSRICQTSIALVRWIDRAEEERRASPRERLGPGTSERFTDLLLPQAFRANRGAYQLQ